MNVAALLDWYERGHRPLPWRRTTDPYALLVSEVMLQQTQVARVVERYARWLERFPTVQALAAAPTVDVLREWSGLGYNRRALNLQRAAAQVARHGWPEDLQALPGVGPYTAAAVGAFAFGRPVAAVDTNVRRVLERHDGVQRTPRALQARADELLPRRRAATFNQAMMELGATVCTPRRPVCDGCPVRSGCAGGETSARPRPRERFEDSDRYLRGRILAAALHGGSPPQGDAARVARLTAALRDEGLL